MSLARLRKEAKLTLHQLAEKSGVNYQKIWQIEHDVIKPKNITLKTAQKLALALNCEPKDFLSSED